MPISSKTLLGFSLIMVLATVPSRAAALSGITITTPSAGAIVSPGQVVPVAVQPLGTFVLSTVLIVTSVGVQTIDQSPFTMNLKIPQEAIGPLPIRALGKDPAGAIVFSDLAITVQPTAPLQSLQADPGQFHFTALGAQQAISVSGFYGDGITRNLTQAGSGTTYHSSDVAVVTVAPSGLMRAQGDGTATVTAANSGILATITVTVEGGGSLAGDLDRNGFVDCSDLAIVKAAFGKQSGQAGFDSRADTNSDNVVNVEDWTFITQKLPAGAPCDVRTPDGGQTNPPPVANVGPEQSINAGMAVTLNGATSNDPNGDPLIFRWTQTAGPPVTLNNASSATPTFTAPTVNTDTTLTFQLIVNDGTTDSTPAQVTITVKAQSKHPVPWIQSPLIPGATAPGGAAFTLTVNGAGFVPASTVQWNGSPRSTTFVSPMQLTAAITADDIATPGTAYVTVTSPGSGVSNQVPFHVVTASSLVTFQVSNITLPSSGRQFVATADFNGDGKLDLAVVEDNTGRVAILLGNGDGTFQTPVEYPVGENPVYIAIGDFNKDGNPDLAVANKGCPYSGGSCHDASVSILLGHGDGTFQASAPLATNLLASSIAIADFNGDGILDLAVETGIPVQQVSIFFGNGNGTFTAGQNFQIDLKDLAVALRSPLVVVGDFNKDGKLDLAITISDETPTGILSYVVVILLGNGDGTFQSPVQYPTGGSPQGIVAADFNGDNQLDLAIGTNPDVSTVTDKVPITPLAVLHGNGDGTFQPHVDYGTPSSFIQVGIVNVIAADFNGDNKPDVGLVRPASQLGDAYSPDYLTCLISVLLGNGDGTFQLPQDFAYKAGAAMFCQAPAVGDFNGDGRPDLAIPYSDFEGGHSQLSILLNVTTGSAMGSAQTTTTLSASTSSLTVGSNLTLTATVLPATISTTDIPVIFCGGVPFQTSSCPTPTGTVTFSTGSTVLGTATVSNGVATYSTQSLSVGTYSISATYSGDVNYASSTSLAISIQVISGTGPSSGGGGGGPSSGGQATSGGSGGGCTLNPSAAFDSMLGGMTGLLLVYLVWQHIRRRLLYSKR